MAAGGGVHDCCLRLGDVAFYDKDTKKLSFRDAQKALSMSIVIRGSKTNQARVGCTRELGRTRLEIDAVKAVANMLHSRSDEWLSNPLRPLFELESGGAISSTRISEVLKRGAADLDLDPRRYATHLLRQGGTTAMAAAETPVEAIGQKEERADWVTFVALVLFSHPPNHRAALRSGWVYFIPRTKATPLPPNPLLTWSPSNPTLQPTHDL